MTESWAEPTPTTSVTATPAADLKHDYSHRLSGWAALCFFSIIALAAHVSDTWDDQRGKDDTFVLVVFAVSAGLSFFSIMGLAVGRDCFSGTAFEGLFAVICILFWICAMPVIMDPDRNIAVSKGTTTSTFIRNANIYFFSWASTIAIVYVLGRYAKQAMLHRQNDPQSARLRLAPKTNLWYLLALASLVVLVDSSELYRAYTCPGDDQDLCLATKYAISMGSVGTFLSFLFSLLATMGRLGHLLEFFGATVIFGLYMAGVALVTFNDGPGTSLGNLYFATWMGCGVTAVLLSRCYMDLLKIFRRRRQQPPQKPDDPSKPQEVPVAAAFPDIEMGAGDKNKPKDKKEGDDENEPSWVTGDPEIHASASVPPPKETKEAKPTDEFEVEIEPTPPKMEKEKISKKADKAEPEEKKEDGEKSSDTIEQQADDEVKPKETATKKKQRSSKNKNVMDRDTGMDSSGYEEVASKSTKEPTKLKRRSSSKNKLELAGKEEETNEAGTTKLKKRSSSKNKNLMKASEQQAEEVKHKETASKPTKQRVSSKPKRNSEKAAAKKKAPEIDEAVEQEAAKAGESDDIDKSSKDTDDKPQAEEAKEEPTFDIGETKDEDDGEKEDSKEEDETPSETKQEE